MLCAGLLLSEAAYSQSTRPVEKAFEIKEADLIPEGIAYDAKRDRFLVGSINKAKIVNIAPDGSVHDFGESSQWGNFGYLGLKVDPEQDVLWACRFQQNKAADSAGWGSLYKISLENGRALKKYLMPATDSVKHLFNDVMQQGKDVYITDSDAGALLWLNPQTDSLEYFLPPGTFVYPNGITLSPQGDGLIIATAAGLFRVNLATREAKPLNSPDYYIIGIDGLYLHKQALVGLQSIIKPETISRFMLDRAGESIQRIEVLANNEPFFEKITTGTLKGDWLYFIANSYVTEVDDHGKIKNPGKLKNPVIYRVKL